MNLCPTTEYSYYSVHNRGQKQFIFWFGMWPIRHYRKLSASSIFHWMFLWKDDIKQKRSSKNKHTIHFNRNPLQLNHRATLTSFEKRERRTATDVSTVLCFYSIPVSDDHISLIWHVETALTSTPEMTLMSPIMYVCQCTFPSCTQLPSPFRKLWWRFSQCLDFETRTGSRWSNQSPPLFGAEDIAKGMAISNVYCCIPPSL